MESIRRLPTGSISTRACSGTTITSVQLPAELLALEAPRGTSSVEGRRPARAQSSHAYASTARSPPHCPDRRKWSFSGSTTRPPSCADSPALLARHSSPSSATRSRNARQATARLSAATVPASPVPSCVTLQVYHEAASWQLRCLVSYVVPPAGRVCSRAQALPQLLL